MRPAWLVWLLTFDPKPELKLIKSAPVIRGRRFLLSFVFLKVAPETSAVLGADRPKPKYTR